MDPKLVFSAPLADVKAALAKAAEVDQSLKAKGICFKCKLPALARCTTEAGRREFQISGMCECCYDVMFAEEE